MAIGPLSLDHVALWLEDRDPVADFATSHLGWHVIERTDRFTLIGADARRGKLTLFDADALAELLDLGLSTGRVRALYGPDGEQAAVALFRRLPLGRELARSASDLNDALTALAGRRVDRITVTAVGPGEYGVTISTDDYEIVLRLGRAGARLATIGA